MSPLKKKNFKYLLIALSMCENIKSFVSKLDIFINDLNKKTMNYFPRLLQQFKTTTNFGNNIEDIENIINH